MNSSLPSQVPLESGWTTQPPTHTGTFLWRKNYQWEPVQREVTLRNGQLVTFSHRYEQPVPVAKVIGEWKI